MIITLHLPLVCKFRPGLVPARLLVCLEAASGPEPPLATLHQIHKQGKRCELALAQLQRGQEKQVSRVWTLSWDCSLPLSHPGLSQQTHVNPELCVQLPQTCSVMSRTRHLGALG